ncbi:MAG: CHASE3 domain-containing protein [Verrucomicrobia bacterium]|nr:CHASE3 domain-containing protein [Verrucomicrobiota bacterium]
MKDKLALRLAALFLIIAAILVAVATVAVRNISRATASSDWVNQTQALILELGSLRAGFHASDAALRALAMGGGEQEAAACRLALAQLADSFEVVKALTRSDPAQSAIVKRLGVLAAGRETLTTESLAARQTGKLDQVRNLLAADVAAGTAGEISRTVEKLKQEQMALLAARDSEAFRQAQTTRWTVWGGVILNFVLLAFTAWLVVDDLASRRRAAAVLQAANEQLETRVRERTAELVAANEKLQTENLERRWSAQALEHQLRYNEAIVNSLSDPVFVLTKAQNISRVNPAVAHVTGWEPPQVINRPLLGFVRLLESPRHFSPGIIDPVAQALKEGRDLRDLPAVVHDRMDREIPVRFTLFPLRDRDKVVGGVVILRLENPPA